MHLIFMHWIDRLHPLGMPPLPHRWGELDGIERDHQRSPRRLLTQNLHAVRRTIPSRQIWREPLANPPPARFFAAPSNAAAGIRQLFAIEQPTASPNHPIGKMPAETLENLTGLKRMFKGRRLHGGRLNQGKLNQGKLNQGKLNQERLTVTGLRPTG